MRNRLYIILINNISNLRQLALKQLMLHCLIIQNNKSINLLTNIINKTEILLNKYVKYIFY